MSYPISMGPSASNVHGSARWMQSADVQAAGLLRSDGVLIGQTASGKLLRFNRDGHIMVFAPTGAGKGIGFVQANLVDYRGSMVVLDPKGENAIVSAGYRRQEGQRVIILDPFGKTGTPTDVYNPLGAISHAGKESIGPMIEAIADAIIPTSEHAREPHWPMGAKRFISFLLWFMLAHLPEDERNLVKLYELAYSGRENLERIARAMAAGLHHDPDVKRVCVAMGHWFQGREEREFSYFESQAQNNLGWVGDFVWSQQLAAKPSPPLPLKAEKITVYLVLPFNRIERYRPWLRLMVADLLNSLYDAPGALQDPVLFMLDEAFAGLGQMESLITTVSNVRSAGARLCFIYQDIQQVQKLYGKEWGSLLSNSGATLFWSVAPTDIETAKLISDASGSRTVPVPGQPMGMGQPIIRPEQVSQLPADEIVAFFRNLPPARFGRLNVRNDNRFLSKLAKNTTYDEATGNPGRVSQPAAAGWVPVDLNQFADVAAAVSPEFVEDVQTKSLSEEFGVRVVKNQKGEFGTLDARGFFVPLKS
jgi:type IV secretion system protein VirD4